MYTDGVAPFARCNSVGYFTLGIFTVSDVAIVTAISEYARAYARLQHLQDRIESLPPGDQKTGCIGEYYVYRYLGVTESDTRLRYGSHSEKGWDIEVLGGKGSYKVQVKTVSAYSKTRTISPIHRGWDRLFIVYLNRKLLPEGFWTIQGTDIFGEKETLKGRKCPDPMKRNTGSKDIPFGRNRVSELIEALNA